MSGTAPAPRPPASLSGGNRYVAKHAKRPEGRAGRRRATGRGRRRGHRILIAVNVVVALSIVTGVAGVWYAEYRLNQIKRVVVKHVVASGHTVQSHVVKGQPVAAGPPETFLIVGSDSRAALNQSGDSKFGSAALVGGARSDTIILARVVPATKQVALLSIPRDTYLEIPGMGMQKINSALSVSPDLLIQVIENHFGIDINHYINVDFDSFRALADALGGVDVYFPTEVRDRNAGLFINSPGCVNLTGDLALAFVRSREYMYYKDGEWLQEQLSDLARIQRQQMFIRKLAAKAQSEGLGDPFRLNGVLAGLTKNLTIDATLSNSALITLAQTFRHVDTASINGWTMPTYATTLYTASGPDDILVPERSADEAMVAQFLNFGQPAATTGATPASGTPASGTPASGTLIPGHGVASQNGATTISSTLPPSSIEVAVANGSGITNQAGTTATGLRSAGFDVVAVQTAPYDHTASVVEYGPGESIAAATVAAHLEGPVTIEQSSGLGSTVDVITGSALGGVRTQAVAGSPSPVTVAATSTVPSTTVPSTTVPSTTTTTYVLPGTPSTGNPACPA